MSLPRADCVAVRDRCRNCFRRRAVNLNSARRPFSRLRKCCGKNWRNFEATLGTIATCLQNRCHGFKIKSERVLSVLGDCGTNCGRNIQTRCVFDRNRDGSIQFTHTPQRRRSVTSTGLEYGPLRHRADHFCRPIVWNYADRAKPTAGHLDLNGLDPLSISCRELNSWKEDAIAVVCH